MTDMNRWLRRGSSGPFWITDFFTEVSSKLVTVRVDVLNAFLGITDFFTGR